MLGTLGAAERLTARLKRPLRTYRAFAQEAVAGMAEAGQYRPCRPLTRDAFRWLGRGDHGCGGRCGHLRRAILMGEPAICERERCGLLPVSPSVTL
jgi:hypothetical protein